MSSLNPSHHKEVLVGLGGSDDAGVYLLRDDLALIQTVDFLTPVADDPFVFGRIAAANALSDVYAMGGKPICAMNLVSFPIDELGVEVLNSLLAGGLEAVEEAGCALVGGHSIEDKELKYGLSVTGVVHPEKVLTNTGVRPGDSLVLTKPLGTGILSTALKGGMAGPYAVEAMYSSMAALNKTAAEVAEDFDVHACTDVTGFGLAGHGMEMVTGSGLTLDIYVKRLPLLPELQKWAEVGLLPGGLHRNRCCYESSVQVDSEVDQFLVDVVYDPQTSGGLLVSLCEEQALKYEQALKKRGISAAVIGRVVDEKSWEGVRLTVQERPILVSKTCFPFSKPER